MIQSKTAIYECSYFDDENNEIDIEIKIPNVDIAPVGLVGFTLNKLENILKELNLSTDAQRQLLDYFYANNDCDDDEYFWVTPDKLECSYDNNMFEDLDFKFEVIDVNVPSKPLSKAGQEFFDKMYGNPCTDMYDFEFFSEQECKEKGCVVGWETKKKENPTQDQQTKRYRIEFSNSNVTEDNINEDIEIDETLLNHVEKEIRNDIDDEILRRLK